VPENTFMYSTSAQSSGKVIRASPWSVVSEMGGLEKGTHQPVGVGVGMPVGVGVSVTGSSVTLSKVQLVEFIDDIIQIEDGLVLSDPSKSPYYLTQIPRLG
jgi:hypothetical protein